MPRQLSVTEARQILELTDRAGPAELRRRYRALARERHPDAGGDQTDFQRLQHAYETLRRHLEGGVGPREQVRRGAAGYTRPDSRRPVDVSAVDWSAGTGTGARISRDRLAVGAAREHPVARVTARSRGPHSLLNWLVPVLSTDFSSSLTIHPGPPGEVALELRVTQGRMRGRLLDAAVPDGWTRTRENRVVTARRTLPVEAETRVNALRAADTAVELLEVLDWPLRAWRSHPADREEAGDAAT